MLENYIYGSKKVKKQRNFEIFIEYTVLLFVSKGPLYEIQMGQKNNRKSTALVFLR